MCVSETGFYATQSNGNLVMGPMMIRGDFRVPFFQRHTQSPSYLGIQKLTNEWHPIINHPHIAKYLQYHLRELCLQHPKNWGLLSVRYWVDLVIQMVLVFSDSRMQRNCQQPVPWNGFVRTAWLAKPNGLNGLSLSSLSSNNPRIVVLRVHHVIVFPIPLL